MINGNIALCKIRDNYTNSILLRKDWSLKTNFIKDENFPYKLNLKSKPYSSQNGSLKTKLVDSL